jgi:hypothetical protein
LFGNATVDVAANVPGRARKSRERVVCTDSVNFRRPGRKAASTPYAAAGSSNEGPSSNRVPSNAADSEDSADDFYDYIDIDSSSSSREVVSIYHDKVGMRFVDIDEDDAPLYIIDSVCRENIPGRRVSFAKLYFKYHEVEGSGEFEYTPCTEMLNSTWCQWQQTPSATARDERATRRVDTPTDRRRLRPESETLVERAISSSKKRK